LDFGIFLVIMLPCSFVFLFGLGLLLMFNGVAGHIWPYALLFVAAEAGTVFFAAYAAGGGVGPSAFVCILLLCVGVFYVRFQRPRHE
jgi:hypothetical protein